MARPPGFTAPLCPTEGFQVTRAALTVLDATIATYWVNAPYAVPIGNDQLLVAWQDSREGSAETDTQDIYLARTNPPPQARSRFGPYWDRPMAVSPWRRPAWATRPAGSPCSTVSSRPDRRAAWSSSPEGDPVAALAGAVLARAHLGPLLVAPPGPPRKGHHCRGRAAPVGRCLPDRQGLLPERGVVDDLADAGVPRPAIVRLAGQGPASTAAIVAEALDRRSDVERQAGKAAFAEAVIVNPSSSTAAAAVAYAATFGRPVLLTDQAGVPAETTTALRSLGIASTLVVGDEAAVSARAAGQLPGAARAGGRDATEAAVSMAEVARTAGAPSNIVYVANAGRPTDAAVVAPAVARVGGLLLLTPDAEVLRADRAISDRGLEGVDQLFSRCMDATITGWGWRRGRGPRRRS